MPWPSHNSTIITSGTAEMVESFKRLQNIMDGKLNTTYKHCQRKLFVAGKLKVLSVADRRLLFGVCPPFILLHRSICCFNGLTVSSSLKHALMLTSLAFRLSQTSNELPSQALRAAHDPGHPADQHVTLLRSGCRWRSWRLFLSYLRSFAQQISSIILGHVVDLWGPMFYWATISR